MRASSACALLLTVALGGCGGVQKVDNFGYGLGESRDHSPSGALRVRWHRTLTPVKRGAYVPVETSVAAVDLEGGKLYVPSVGGSLFALEEDGTRVYRLEIGSPMESEPALDSERDQLYFGTERNQLISIVPSRGEIRWRTSTSGSVRRKPVLTEDAVFVITENDVVEAFAREDGSVLWRYEREPQEGFLVAGHAGLAHVDGHLYTAFNDGAVVCLDILNGNERWTQETARDAPPVEPGLPQYLDADTTPVVLGDVVYAASFGAGLYALDAGNGSLLWRKGDWTGIVGIAAVGEDIVVSSADLGVARVDVASQNLAWIVPIDRGTASPPRTVGDIVLFGESHGGLIAVDAHTGKELNRVETTHGFEALPVVEGPYGYVLTNGGTLLALSVAR